MSQLAWLIVAFWASCVGICVAVGWMLWDQTKLEKRVDKIEGEHEAEKRGAKDALAALKPKVAAAIKSPPILGNDYESKHRSDRKNDYKDSSPSTAKHRKES